MTVQKYYIGVIINGSRSVRTIKGGRFVGSIYLSENGPDQFHSTGYPHEFGVGRAGIVQMVREALEQGEIDLGDYQGTIKF